MKTITITFQIPDGVEVDIQRGAPAQAAYSPSAPSAPSQAVVGAHDCPQHGEMEFKKGTSKAGNDYAGWFCPIEGCATPPVWAPKPKNR